jgi:hypothetical protein
VIAIALMDGKYTVVIVEMSGSDDQEVWQKEQKLTRKCHTEYPDKLKQNDWDDK